MRNILISIVVPVYNVAEYIDRCLYSLINQTYPYIEILLVDDGSKDCSGSICDNYARCDDRIKVIHKSNGGLSDARNVGLSLAQGEYVMFVDSDDWIEKNACERFLAYIEANPTVDMFIGLLRNEDGSLYSERNTAALNKEYVGKEYFAEFYKSIKVCAVTNVYKREFLIKKNLSFPVGLLHEDVYFSQRAFTEADRVIYTDIVFYVRFIREGSITQKTDKRKNVHDLLIIAHRLLEHSYSIANRNIRSAFQNHICDSYLSLFYSADIYQYTDMDYRQFVDKKLVMQTAKNGYNRLRALLFAISPRLYIAINRIKKLGIKN